MVPHFKREKQCLKAEVKKQKQTNKNKNTENKGYIFNSVVINHRNKLRRELFESPFLIFSDQK